ncbi:MAG: hypothetical protein ACI8WB_004085 [Phenylobacterium sp.]|jgi:hypothetical protein
MGIILRFGLLSLWLMTSLALAAGPGAQRTADTKVEYKCHFELVGGQQVIHFLNSRENYAKQLQQKMTGKTIFAKDGVTKRYIYRVFECVKSQESFRSVKAQDLDAQTLS